MNDSDQTLIANKNAESLLLQTITVVNNLIDSDAECFIIDNCIVSKYMSNGIRITPIGKQTKYIDLNKIPKISAGNRLSDNNLLRKLSDGDITFNNIINKIIKL